MKESGKLLGALDEHDGHIAHGDEHDGDWERHEIGASGDNDCRGHDGTKDLTDGVGDIESLPAFSLSGRTSTLSAWSTEE